MVNYKLQQLNMLYYAIALTSFNKFGIYILLNKGHLLRNRLLHRKEESQRERNNWKTKIISRPNPS